MKHIYKLISFSCFTIFMWSCSDDIEQIVISSEIGNSAVISTPLNDDTFVLNPFEAPSNTAITITWDNANYNAQIAKSYAVEFAKAGTNFAEPLTSNITTNTYLLMSVFEFNAIASSAGLLPFVEGELDIRIKSVVGAHNELPKYSDFITIIVTPYTTDVPTIAVPGSHQGWDPPTAPLLASEAFGQTNYEGYVWLEGNDTNIDNGHKFLAPNSSGDFAWGNIDWGDDGTDSGVLVEDGEENVALTVTGHYFVQVDTEALTYSETLYNWGVIGSATADNWDSDQDLTYNPTSKTWEITLDLSAEEIKFRANDDWAWNYGDTGADGSLEFEGENIVITVAGNYTVILDLSSPREYSYTLTLN